MSNKHATSCNQTTNIQALSIFTAATSAMICIAATVINLLLLYVFKRNAIFFKRRASFYGLLLNIVLADLSTGIFSSGFSVYFHTKEALGLVITTLDSRLLHSSILIINGASVLTMSLLCVERMLVLFKPYLCKQTTGTTHKLMLVGAGIWLVASLSVIPYFKSGYIRYLLIFSGTTVLLTFIFLLATTFVYKSYFDSRHKLSTGADGYWKPKSRPFTNRKPCTGSECSHMPRLTSCPGYTENTEKQIKSECEINFGKRLSERRHGLSIYSSPADRVHEKQKKPRIGIMHKLKPKFTEKLCSRLHHTTPANSSPCTGNISSMTMLHKITTTTKAAHSKRNTKKSDERIHRSFLAMLVVFLATYLPSVLMIVYMNLCKRCSCTLVHTLRDLTTLGIMASAFFRPLNFVLTLKTLRKAISRVFKADSRYRSDYIKSVSSDLLDSYPGSPIGRFPARSRIVTI